MSMNLPTEMMTSFLKSLGTWGNTCRKCDNNVRF